MFNIKDQICVGGSPNKPNEDCICYGEKYCFVMDGASGLSGIHLVDDKSDAAWFVHRLKEELCAVLDMDEHTPTAEIISVIIHKINMEYEQAAMSRGMDIPSDSPSAGIALFRERLGRIEFFGVGDCTAVIQCKDGPASTIKETALPSLDQHVLNRMAQIHQQTGVSVLEARQQCNDMLLRNRNLRNQEDGYWILDLSGVGISHAREYNWPAEDVVSVFACTDGFGQLIDTFHVFPDYMALYQAVQNLNINAYTEYLFQLQEKDSEANDYPRFKFRDDTSALWGYFL